MQNDRLGLCMGRDRENRETEQNRRQSDAHRASGSWNEKRSVPARSRELVAHRSWGGAFGIDRPLDSPALESLKFSGWYIRPARQGASGPREGQKSTSQRFICELTFSLQARGQSGDQESEF